MSLACGALGGIIVAPGRLASFARSTASMQDLPRSTPEAQGVESEAILRFLHQAAEAKQELHSLIIARNGCIVAEAWWAPYRRNAIHSLYSLSKCFTSTAVGFAIGEGKLHVNDPVIGFFPEQVPAKINTHLRELRIEHLLTMSTGHSKDPKKEMIGQDDWVKAYLSTPIDCRPGSAFVYSSAASYILSAVVQAVTGQKLIDYLRPRLFEPLNISERRWEMCPRGINTGGWGLSVTSESLAKFGQLYLQKGRWNGMQLLTESYINAATSARIRSSIGSAACHVPKESTIPDEARDWHQGYGYQFWRCRHEAYRGDGAFGQFCIVVPHQQLVVVMTSRTMNMQGLLNLTWDLLLPAMHRSALVSSFEASEALQRELASAALPLPSGNLLPARPSFRRLCRKFKLEPNVIGAISIGFRFENGSCDITLVSDKGIAKIKYDIGQWTDASMDLPALYPQLLANKNFGPASVAAAGDWTSDNTLQIQLRYYETPHYQSIVSVFEEERVTITITSDLAFQIILLGQLDCEC